MRQTSEGQKQLPSFSEFFYVRLVQDRDRPTPAISLIPVDDRNAAIITVPILILAAASWKSRCAVKTLNDTLTALKRREVLIRVGITAWTGNNVETKVFCLMAGITRRR